VQLVACATVTSAALACYDLAEFEAAAQRLCMRHQQARTSHSQQQIRSLSATHICSEEHLQKKLASLSAVNSALHSENEELRQRVEELEDAQDSDNEERSELQGEFQRRLGQADKQLADLRVCRLKRLWARLIQCCAHWPLRGQRRFVSGADSGTARQ
jgi:regulator of replication initiation timing